MWLSFYWASRRWVVQLREWPGGSVVKNLQKNKAETRFDRWKIQFGFKDVKNISKKKKKFLSTTFSETKESVWGVIRQQSVAELKRITKLESVPNSDDGLLHSPWCWVGCFCWEMGGLPDWGQVRVVRGLQFCLAHRRGCGVGLNYPGAACLIWPATFGDGPKAE